jgi:hypothetical protein
MHYTAKIRRKLKGEQYQGFFADAMWPFQPDGSINVDFIPIAYFDRYENEAIEKLRVNRNTWVFICWTCLVIAVPVIWIGLRAK